VKKLKNMKRKNVVSRVNLFLVQRFLRIVFTLIVVSTLISSVSRSEIYVSPTGSDATGTGTIDNPFLTLSTAVNHPPLDSLIYMRGGSYPMPASLNITKIATANKYLKIWAYPGEVPILDFSSQTGGSDGIKLKGSYVHFKGIVFYRAAHNGLNLSGHYNIIENCIFRDNRNTGLQMGSSSDSISNPSHNLILNCDAYRNYDPPIGGNADGFGIKWNIGSGNVFRGCRAYNNSDDGWDLWMADSSIVIDSCMAFRNGVDIWHSGSFDGNGNGFKLGGNNIATHHTTRNCVSFDNAGNGGRGFDENNNLAGQTLYNCTAYRNTGDNYHFNNTVISGQHIIKNCVSYTGNVSITSGTRTNNSWQGFTVTNDDFQSFDTLLAVLPRDTNGVLQNTAFLKLTATSDLIDGGVNVGLPYLGSAPDLGAYEYIRGLPVYSLNTNAVNGVITVNPNKTTFDSGAVVQLFAYPNRGYHFTGWSGDTSGTSNPISVVMLGNKSFTANFAITTYTLNVGTNGNGTATKSPNHINYDTGSVVILTATPSLDWKFTGWSGDLTGMTNPDTIIMTGNTTISANFMPDTLTVTFTVPTGWNIISLPVKVNDPIKNLLFSTSISTAFAYAGSYVQKDTIEQGKGYWLKFPSAQLISINGVVTRAETLHVNTGWNLIGTISSSVPISTIIQQPSGIIESNFYSFTNGYEAVDTILPGKGYWLRVSAGGTLILSHSTFTGLKNQTGTHK